MNLATACTIVKEFADEHQNGDLLEGVQLMDIHKELGLLTEEQRRAITMFMTAGRKMFTTQGN